MMTFIDFFSGIGGFRRGMELAGHKCVGHCEIDKYADASYRSMHTITEEQREYLAALTLKQRQKEILKGEYLNGEWFADDIRRVYSDDIPRADCWCFGFPCQDISPLKGKRLGLQGSSSSLFFRIMYLLGQIRDEEKPGWLFIENVKNLLRINDGWDFARLLVEMDLGGYDAQWQTLNSKEFGVPQNRERVFVVGNYRGQGRREIFPICTYENKTPILQVAEWDVERKNSNNYRIYSPKGVAPTLTATTGGGKNARVIIGKNIRMLTPKEYFRLQGWSDDYFNKAAFVNSDAQLYKQAGNGVTVNVIYEIAKRMK